MYSGLALPCDKSSPSLHGANESLGPARTEPETPGSSTCAADLLLLPCCSSEGCSTALCNASPMRNRKCRRRRWYSAISRVTKPADLVSRAEGQTVCKEHGVVLLHSGVACLWAQGHTAGWVACSTSFPTSQLYCVVNAKKSLQFPSHHCHRKTSRPN